jgi:hypothetical protein
MGLVTGVGEVFGVEWFICCQTLCGVMPKPVCSKKRIAATMRAFLIVVLMIFTKITNTTQATIKVKSISGS